MIPQNALNPAWSSSAYASPDGAGGATPNAAGTAAMQSPPTPNNAAEAQALMTAGVELLQQHRYGEALELFQEGFRLYPDRNFILNEAAEAFREGFRTYPDEKLILNEAAALLDGGRYSQADLTYQRYLANPDAPRADEARAAQQRARDAVGGREAKVTDVDNARAAFARGDELYKNGRYAEALGQYEKAYNYAAAPETLFNRAACLEKLGRREDASKLYAQYAKEMPTAPDAAKTAKHAAALHTEALKLARSAFERGDVAFKEKRYGDAAMAYAEANAQVPSSAARYNLASSLDAAGETAKAVREYQLYLNETPNAPDADQVRARIEALQAQTGTELMKP